jgi:4-hydroxy-tetrahydrodipicolinate reductase
MIRVAVNGALGRMGRLLISHLQKDPELELCAALVRPHSAEIGKLCSSNIVYTSELSVDTDVLLDFTSVSALLSRLELCRQRGIGVVSGTTGFQEKELEILKESAQDIPIFWSSNLSIGATLLKQAALWITSHLPEGYDIEILEMHHRHKKDVPSGTAQSLATTLIDNLQRTPEVLRYGRPRSTQDIRTPEEIGIHSLRLGGVVGRHHLYFGDENELIEFSHHAFSREVFVQGALKALHYLSKQKPGCYGMEDLLGFSKPALGNS